MTTERRIMWTKEELLRDFPELVQVSGPAHMQPIEEVNNQITTTPGLLFIPGVTNRKVMKIDQEKLIQRALFEGAAAAITDKDIPDLPSYAPVFRCDDRNEILRRMAQLGRARLKGQCVAITGSYGKTTTCELASQMQGFFGPTATTTHNRNHTHGVAMTLAMVAPHTRDLVLEIGMFNPGDVLQRARPAAPDIGILTTVADSHLGNFEDQQALLREKASLLDVCSGAHPALIGRAALDLDQEGDGTVFSSLPGGYLSVGREARDDIQLLEMTDLDNGAMRITVRVLEETIEAILPVNSIAVAMSATFALGLAHIKGLPLADAARALSCYRQVAVQRGSRYRISPTREKITYEVIEDAQNATPPTVRALLGSVAGRHPRRKVLVLGDMLDLGEDEIAKHLDLAPDIEKAGIDMLVTVGPLAGELKSVLSKQIKVVDYEDLETAKKKLRPLLKHGDLVLLKGTGYMKIDTLRKTFSIPDRQHLIRSAWQIEEEVRKKT
ncbi:Mur ligase family protein [uncultured Sulfitobacter sp.]|uniref:glutamate ligase domain-containing protein n=1 Tax=uncultured Sulfitobacter sp. TaxID=191468 RepID=UPI002602A3E7|nr:Mur ligase family protein [uncultured Sulfitobacter sp.]